MKANQISNAHAYYLQTTSGQPSSSLPSWILRSLISTPTGEYYLGLILLLSTNQNLVILLGVLYVLSKLSFVTTVAFLFYPYSLKFLRNVLLADLIPLQHSFRRDLSCTTQLLTVLHDIGIALDKGLEIDAIYLDLTRSFGTVCHSRLLCKLQALGISGSLLSWFSDYLSSRRQRVVLNGTSSPWECVRSGVPRGSVLDPILFILFINDIPDCLLSSRIAMFTDNVKCYSVIHSSSDVANLQGDLHRMSNWHG